MPQLLIFSKTAGYRHDESIHEGIALLRARANEEGIGVDATEDSGVFTSDNLAGYDAVVWLQVSGNVLEAEERAAFEEYLSGGGGFAGIHGTTDAERAWPTFEQIVGARFLHHPADQSQQALITVEDSSTPSTATLPEKWEWVDEWYCFDSNPRPRVNVLLTVDEMTYDTEGITMGGDHPLSWSGTFGAGVTWYTALGHHPENYADPHFRDHLWGGVSSVLRARR